MPSRADERRLLESKPCLDCTHFDYSNAAREAMRKAGWDRIIDRSLIRRRSHSTIRGKEYGICGAATGRACSPMAPGCDQWSPRRKGWKHFMRSAADIAKSAAQRVHLRVVSDIRSDEPESK